MLLRPAMTILVTNGVYATGGGRAVFATMTNRSWWIKP